MELTVGAGPRAQAAFSERLESAYFHIGLLSSHFCFHIAKEFKLFERDRLPAFDALLAATGIVPEGAYLLRTVLDTLTEDGYLAPGLNGWEILAPCPLDEAAELYRVAERACPEARPILALMQRCHQHARAFLTGRQSGVSVIFPRGDMTLWESVHREDAVMSIYAGVIPQALADCLQGKKDPRTLEVGAGVGAVLRRCLTLIEKQAAGEYWFTDLGQLFVQRAQRDFAHLANTRFAILDLDSSLEPQGIAPASFDAAVGVNVLHAVRNLEFTLRELRKALRERGSLILGEGSPPRRGKRWPLDFVFAFLRGWWDVTLDATYRPREGFLFPREWEKILAHCGFEQVSTSPGEEWFAGDCRGGLVVAVK